MNYCFRIFKNIFLSLFIFLSFVFYGGCENGTIGNGLLTLNCNSILLTAIELIVVFYEQMLVELHTFYIVTIREDTHKKVISVVVGPLRSGSPPISISDDFPYHVADSHVKMQYLITLSY